jgi:uroporphyrinogen-III decarboxylase
MDADEIKALMDKGMQGDMVLAAGEGITPRERWRRTFHYQSVDRVPHYEFGYWDELYAEWRAQGMPGDFVDEGAADRYFGFDRRLTLSARNGLYPDFEPEVLGEDERHVLVRDENGVLCEINKDGTSSIPHYIEFPIKDRADWVRFKERLAPHTPGRIPDNLDELAEIARRSTVPVGIGIGSLFGWPRNWIGFENIAILVYDDPELIDEIVETVCELIVTTAQPLLERIEFDYAAGWEDVAFNQGPIISPTMWRRFLTPRYKRIAHLLHQHGVTVIWTDCDGNIMPIAEQWIEAGYNTMFPIEVRGGSDPVALRRRFGRDVLLLGGFDKMALYKGPEAILAELKRLAPEVERGGFIPHVDHRVPGGVSLRNYRYYLREKKALLGFPPGEQDDHVPLPY